MLAMSSSGTPFSPLQFWYLAMAAEIGIVIETSDRERLKQTLYRARATAMDEALSSLSIQMSPLNPSQVWIVKNAKPDSA